MIINLTPHPINIMDEKGVYNTIVPTLPSARCFTKSVEAGFHDGVPLTRKEYGEVKDLPEPVYGTVYIVSMLVRQRSPARLDLTSPGTIVRDSEGKIIGCKTLDMN